MRWFTQSMSVNPPPFWITFELDYRVMLFVLGLVAARQPVCRGSAGAACDPRQRRLGAEG